MAQIYDYAIIGSGLTGLSIAAALSRETKNIALLESSDIPGGSNRKIEFPTGPLNNGLRFVPDSLAADKALSFLSQLLGTAIVSGKTEQAPITYEAGGLKTFLGFGDQPPAFYEEINYFTSTKQMDLAIEPYDWTRMLFEKFRGDFLPRSYVTKFHHEGERITHLTINGAKTLQAHNYIFCGTVKDLALLLPEEVLSQRARTKLSKSPYWTALCLDLCHSRKISDTLAIHILNGTTQDEIGPCAGRFLPAVELEGETLQASQWITFIEQEIAEDSEIVGTSLKKIKRQLKRAYPEALEDLRLERIFVAPILSGNGELKLNGDMTLPSLQNLWVSSATLNEQKNLLGALLQAEITLASLGFKVDQVHEEPGAVTAEL